MAASYHAPVGRGQEGLPRWHIFPAPDGLPAFATGYNAVMSASRLSLPLWNERYASPPLPMTRAEMTARGWDAVDVVFVTGDAYVDHPSFAMAILGRVLEGAGFRVAIL